MDKQTLEILCLKLPGTTHDFKIEWNADRYQIGGKMFALIGTDARKKTLISLKCDPDRSQELRDNYKGVIPGYHLNKTHWNSIYFDANIPEDLWEKLIVHSYELVFQKLPVKVKKEITSDLRG